MMIWRSLPPSHIVIAFEAACRGLGLRQRPDPQPALRRPPPPKRDDDTEHPEPGSSSV